MMCERLAGQDEGQVVIVSIRWFTPLGTRWREAVGRSIDAYNQRIAERLARQYAKRQAMGGERWATPVGPTILRLGRTARARYSCSAQNEN